MPPRQPSTRTPLDAPRAGRATPSRRPSPNAQLRPRAPARTRGVWAGDVLTQSDPPLWNRASMPSSAQTRPISSTVANICLLHAHRGVVAVALRQRRQRRGEERRDPAAVAAGGAEAGDVLLHHGHAQVRVGLGEVVRGPEPRVAGADDGDIDVGGALESGRGAGRRGRRPARSCTRGSPSRAAPPSLPPRGRRMRRELALDVVLQRERLVGGEQLLAPARRLLLHRRPPGGDPLLDASRGRRGGAGRTRRSRTAARVDRSATKWPPGPRRASASVSQRPAGDVDAGVRRAAPS